jgi:hypothetical protein
MTSTQYLFYYAASALGIRSQKRRMIHAADEKHLLLEAESYLGKAIWEQVEHIEELSVEYWNLRKLMKEHDRVADVLKIQQQQLAEIHAERAGHLRATNEPFQDLLEERQNLFNSLKELVTKRDMILNEARDVRRLYEGRKVKQEILTNEEASKEEEELSDIKIKIDQLKSRFALLKVEGKKIADRIAEESVKIDEVDAEIMNRKLARRELASDAFQHIVDINQKISKLSSEMSALDTQISRLYGGIGKFVSRNLANPECLKVCGDMQWLTFTMSALRKSITWNYKIAGKI